MEEVKLINIFLNKIKSSSIRYIKRLDYIIASTAFADKIFQSSSNSEIKIYNYVKIYNEMVPIYIDNMLEGYQSFISISGKLQPFTDKEGNGLLKTKDG